MSGTITGKHILYDVSLTVNGVDLSNRVEKLEIKLGTNKQVGAAMGDTRQTRLPPVRGACISACSTRLKRL